MYTKEQAKEVRMLFWSDFKMYSKKAGRKMTSWVLKKTQMREVQLKFDITPSGAFVMLQIDHKFDDRRIEIYNRFVKYKMVIDETCGEELIWDPHYFMEGHKEISVIYYFLDGVNVYDKEQWPKIFAFFMSKMNLLEISFLDVKDVVKSIG